MPKDLTKDLEKMSRDELLKVQKQVEKLITTLADRERKAALKAAEEAAKKHGFSLADLGVSAGKPRKSKAPAAANPPKYRNPEDASQTWSGRGRRPQWVKDAEAKGSTLESLAI
ncbi:MAG: H-NS histone family protein [Pseudomonadota bacterium]